MSAAAPLPGSLAKFPKLDDWLAIETDGTLTVKTGKVEIGQGIKTAIAMIAAEELDIDIARVRILSGETGAVADEGVTSGSGSMEQSGRAMRQAAAEARSRLVELAAAHLGVGTDSLEVDDGTVRSPETNQQVSYWDLSGGKPFDIEATGTAQPKDPAGYSIVGQRHAELDAVAKVTGGAVFVHDLAPPDMLHGRILRPPSYHAQLLTADTSAIEGREGVIKVIHDGNFLAVIAETEDAAVRAREALAESCSWQEEPSLPDEDSFYAWLVENDTQANPVIDGTPTEDPVPAIAPPAGAAQTLEAAYAKPYIMHGSIGPSAAVARLAAGQLTIHSPSQGPYPLRRALAASLDMDEDDISVIHAQGAGCYGHNGADDVSLDAALLAMAVPGRPVRVQWMREDEHRWEPYSPAQVVMTNGSLDEAGNIIDFNLDLYSTTHQGRPRPATKERSSLLADWHREPSRDWPESKQGFSNESGAHRNAMPYYDFEKRIVSHFVKPQPLRTSSLRGLGSFANIFAIESFMDELAEAAGTDKLEFRLRHLSDPRARNVLETAAHKLGWPPPAPGSGRGAGIAFNRYKNSKAYVAVGMEVEVEPKTGAIKVARAVVCGDAGQVVSPGGLRGQMEGGVIQAISWCLKERVRFDPMRVTSVDWETYPILTFPEVPEIETVLIDKPGEPYLGAGEGSQNPAGAALANAVANATGVRLRELPFTPERVRAMLSAAGK